MPTDIEIAQYVEAAVESLTGIIFALWGLWAGGFIATFMGRKSDARRYRHRFILYTLASAAIFMSLGMWILVEGGGDTIRSDGVNAEYGRQIAYLAGATGVVIALAHYGYFTFAAGSISAVLMAATYASLIFATLVVTTDLYWVLFAFWFFFLATGAYNTFTSFNIQPTIFYANYISAGLLYLHVVLHGLFLILSKMVSDEISLLVEASLYAAFGPLMLLVVGILIAVTFESTAPLFARRMIQKIMPARVQTRTGTSVFATYSPPSTYGGHGYKWQ